MMSTKIPTQKTCSRCLKLKNSKDNYYLSSDNLIHKDDRIGVCKHCLVELMGDFKDVENVIEVLRRIDKPFIKDLYDKAIATDNAIGRYFKDIAMPQNKNKTYMDSQFNESLDNYRAKNSNDLNKKIEIEEAVKLKVTPDLIVKWGSGYTESELFQLEQFYIKMKQSNDISTPQHIESLKILCKLSLKQNKALDEDNHTAFKNLNTQYNKVLQDSGFRPIDKTGSNESVGIRSFSQIWEEIERDGFIPKHKVETTQDIVDGTLLHTENYTRRLLNMQVVSNPSGDVPQVGDY